MIDGRDFDVLMVIISMWRQRQISSIARHQLARRIASAGHANTVDQSLNRLVREGYLSEANGALDLTFKAIELWLRSAYEGVAAWA